MSGKGCNFSFYNLQNENIHKGQFKHSKFNSTDLRNCSLQIVISQDVNFLIKDLRGTALGNCRFKGEEVFFNGA